MKKFIVFILCLLLLAGCAANKQEGSGNGGGNTPTNNSGGSGGNEGSSDEPSANMPNPWLESANLGEAEKHAGFDFTPPSNDVIPEGFNFVTYLASEGTIEALFTDGDSQLVIRKSTKTKGKELSGDYNTYSKSWTQTVNGLEVSFEGDGELANIATFETEDGNFSIGFKAGQEGEGLSAEQVLQLMISLLADDVMK